MSNVIVSSAVDNFMQASDMPEMRDCIGSPPIFAPINNQTGTEYELTISDTYSVLTMNNAGANTLTIPTNASVTLPVGTMIEVWRLGAGETTISAPSGVTLNGVEEGSVVLAAVYAPATLRKIGTDAWLIAVGGAADVA